MAPPPRRGSLLSDDLLRHLIAVGQVDLLVGLPTLDNAATVEAVVVAIHEAIARSFPRARVTLINSDGGSADGTQDALQRAAGGSTDVLLASHTLRTMHRVVAPFHGLPGRRAALQVIFTAADLLQARAVAIIDPSTVDPSPDVMAGLMRTVLGDEADFVGQVPVRDPREGPLLSQVVRPVLATVLGACFDDPLGQQFALSGRFVAHMLAQPVWEDEPLRAGVDLALHTEALACGFRTAQLGVRTRDRLLHPGRPGTRETVQQVVRALWVLLGRHQAAWLAGAPAVTPPPYHPVETGTSSAPGWDVAPLERSFREGVQQLSGVWRDILPPASMAALESAIRRDAAGLEIEDWAAILVDVCVAWRAGRFTPDQLAGAFVPLYFGRLAAFARETAALDAVAAAAHLQQLEHTLAGRRTALVERWSAAGDGDLR